MTRLTTGIKDDSLKEWTRMRFGRHLILLGILICIVFFEAGSAIAQTETATVSGLIVDFSGAIVRRAEVELHSVQQGTDSTGVNK
jgi:hypothetical protein